MIQCEVEAAGQLLAPATQTDGECADGTSDVISLAIEPEITTGDSLDFFSELLVSGYAAGEDIFHVGLAEMPDVVNNINRQCFLVGKEMIETTLGRRRELAELVDSYNIVATDEESRHRDIDDEFPSIRFPWHTFMISAFPGIRR